MTVDFRPLVDGLSVAPQVTEADIRAAHAAGFRTIINNRPDGEEPGQFLSVDAARAAAALDMTYIYLPATMPTLEATVPAFAEALAHSPGPILAHCRSGTRSTILWALAEAKAGTHNRDAILRSAASAGYDLSAYAGMIDQYTRLRA